MPKTEMRKHMSELDKLRLYLAALPAGTVGEVRAVEDLLAEAWDEFEGSDQGGMVARKVLGRTEKMEWNPPVLTFDLERHGATVRGSTGAEIQSWTINTADGKASVAGGRFRQVHARSPNWDAKAVAQEIAQLIIAKQEDPRLIWNQKGHVRPDIGNIVPGVNKQTREDRSRRFWDALLAELLPHSWVKIGRHLEKADPNQEGVSVESTVANDP
jgi:hypothetical protein